MSATESGDDRERLTSELDGLRREQATFRAVTTAIRRALATQLSLREMVGVIGDALVEAAGLDHLTITWCDEPSHLLHYLYNVEHGERIDDEVVQPPTPGGTFEKIRATKRAIIVRQHAVDAQAIPGTDPTLMGDAIAPIIVDDRVVGLLTVPFDIDDRFDESGLPLLKTVAAGIGSVLELTRVLEEKQRLLVEVETRAGELEVINTIQRGIAAELDDKAIAGLVGARLCQLFRVETLTISRFDHDTSRSLSLLPRRWCGDGDTARNPFGVVRADAGVRHHDRLEQRR